MVHALQEARRVLKPDGILIDLRPAAEHRRLGLGQGRRWRFLSELHEILDDDHAADSAVATVLRSRLFRLESRTRIQLDRVMDTVDEFRLWLSDFGDQQDWPAHTALIERLERERDRLPPTPKINVRGPLVLGVLRNFNPAPHSYQIGETMILGILPNTSKAESLLNNLSEADFDLNSVSVVMKDVALRNKIAKDAGPLRGMQAADMQAALNKAGLSQEAAQRCQEAVANGKVLVAMTVDSKYEKAAREMFGDHSAEMIKE